MQMSKMINSKMAKLKLLDFILWDGNHMSPRPSLHQTPLSPLIQQERSDPFVHYSECAMESSCKAVQWHLFVLNLYFKFVRPET